MPQQRRKRSVNGRIGGRLTETRLNRGLSQARLARAIGVTVGTIQAYERGRARVTVERLEALAEALQCEAIDLLKPASAPLPRYRYRPRPAPNGDTD